MTHVLKENLQNTTSFLINETGDTLHTTTASKTTDSLSNYISKVGKAGTKGSVLAWWYPGCCHGESYGGA